jgi:ATP-binding cassette, subfamily B, bacterial HlyB/CyaB
MKSEKILKPADLEWFTHSTIRFTRLLVELAVISAVLRLMGLVEPFVFQTLIDRVLPFKSEISLNIILIVLLGVTFFSVAFGAISSLLGAQIANRLTLDLGSKMYTHTLSLPAILLQRFKLGEILARLREIDNIRELLTSTVTELTLDLLFTAVYLVALYSLSPLLTLILVVMLPLQMVSFAVFGPFVRKRMQEEFEAGAVQQSRQAEAFSNIIIVKSIAAEAKHSKRMSDALENSLFMGWQVTKIYVVSEAFGQFLRGMSVVLIIYYGSGQVLAGTLTFGQLVAFHLLSQNVAGPILSLSKIWEKWQELRIARLRLGDLLNESSESDAALPVLVASKESTIEARKMSFSYFEEQPVFSNLSLIFPACQTSVIMGDSGCGKSTLAKLLCGLYPPTTGEVLFAGQNVSKYDPASVRQRISYVAQEPILFGGSILDNLLIVAPEATNAQIESALRQSEASAFVNQMPQGLDTQVGERGGFLSGGQRQRIAIARSLLTDPDVLVLDEPTSSLDEETSQKVMQALTGLSTSKTVIIITHRADLVKGKVNVVDLNKVIRSAHV